jgi:hypothetical protein
MLTIAREQVVGQVTEEPVRSLPGKVTPRKALSGAGFAPLPLFVGIYVQHVNRLAFRV